MTRPRDEELLETLELFVLRARRVLANSLASNDTALDLLASGGWIAIRKDGHVSLQRRLPSEEALESLASRVRPLTLKKDPVHYDRVLNALRTLLARRGEDRDAQWCRELKADWRSVDPATEQSTYYLEQWTPDGEEASVRTTDAALALNWFYGDLVHADKDHVREGSPFGINQRFAAAAVRTAQLAIMTRDTFNFVRLLANDQVIQLGSAALETEVQVGNETVRLAGVYMAQPGTVPPMPGDAFSEKWKKMEGPWLGHQDGEWTVRIPWGC